MPKKNYNYDMFNKFVFNILRISKRRPTEKSFDIFVKVQIDSIRIYEGLLILD